MSSIIVRDIGLIEYQQAWQRMQALTDNRDEQTVDELWLLQHPRVFTQGQAGKAEHLLMPGDIPVIQVDRGGQVTYHGPGQLVVYFMLDIKRLGIGVRNLVTAIEESTVNTLAHFGVESAAKPDAPGVYIDGTKVASLGLRVRRGCSFHGLAINVDMDLEPFNRVNPCGYAGMVMTQVAHHAEVTLEQVADQFVTEFCKAVGYTQIQREAPEMTHE